MSYQTVQKNKLFRSDAGSSDFLRSKDNDTPYPITVSQKPSSTIYVQNTANIETTRPEGSYSTFLPSLATTWSKLESRDPVFITSVPCRTRAPHGFSIVAALLRTRGGVFATV